MEPPTQKRPFALMYLTWQIFSLEIRKILSYRADFWMNFIGVVLAEVAVAYFLWNAIFEYKNVSTMQGYSFHGLMLYYLLAPLMTLIVRGQSMDFMAREIYEGTLTRYLIYPLSFFHYKYVAQLAYSFIATLQLILMLGFFTSFFGLPKDLPLH